MNTQTTSIAMLAAAMLVAPAGAHAATAQPMKAKAATASSSEKKYPASKAIDGVISDDSRWVSAKGTTGAWLEIDLGGKQRLAGIHLYSGFGAEAAVADFAVEFWSGGKWQEIPSAVVTGNNAVALAVPFDQTVSVETDKLRLVVKNAHQGVARVKEIVVWPYSVGDLPAVKGAAAVAVPQSKIPLIYLNQSGFNLGKPKRFTAPTLADGTKFIVRPAAGGDAVAEGVIKGKLGDFSRFNPIASGVEYVVEAGGLTSVPFRIGPWWLERVTYQGAVDFMIDGRHYVGNDRAKCKGSFGWRDDHHFGWELHSLVAQWISNPSAYERMPRQIKYEKPKDPKLWGSLDPYKDDAPDIVKLIHWGADVIVTQGLTHEMLKAQLPYFLYAWPVLKPYMPEQNYKAVSDYTFRVWREKKADQKYPYDESSDHDMLALKQKVGSTKGSNPPGFSIQPNLLMYEVAKRDKQADADIYLEAAVKQAEWMVANTDWNDPLVTKGQRMSEFITMTGLAQLQRDYPDKAPAGLKAKIAEWAKVAMRRADNMWDFRKLDDGDKWTPMGDSPQKWNEPGNVVGFPAALLAAIEVIDDPATRSRLEELVYSHFDNMFGRNPVGRHFSFDAPREVEGVEFGWFKFLPGGIGRLAEARFVIDGSPKDGHYPYHPEKGDFGWTEGWIQFNTPFNASLSYLAYSETKLDIARNGDSVVIKMVAPLNFDYEKAEAATVTLATPAGVTGKITLTESAPNSSEFTATLPAAKVPSGSMVSYGFGYLGHKATLP